MLQAHLFLDLMASAAPPAWLGEMPSQVKSDDENFGVAFEWPTDAALDGVVADGTVDMDGAVDRNGQEEAFECLEYIITFYHDCLVRLHNFFSAAAEYRRSRALRVPVLTVERGDISRPGTWALQDVDYVLRSEAHAIKGTASNLNLKKLWRVGRACELPCKSLSSSSGQKPSPEERRALLDKFCSHHNVMVLFLQFRALVQYALDTESLEAALGQSIADACGEMGDEGDGSDETGRSFYELYRDISLQACDCLISQDVPLFNPFAKGGEGGEVYSTDGGTHPLEGALSAPAPAPEETGPLSTGSALQSNNVASAASSSSRSEGSSGRDAGKPTAVHPASAVELDSCVAPAPTQSAAQAGSGTAEPIEEVQSPTSGGGCCAVM
jgi:hypothetical protein